MPQSVVPAFKLINGQLSRVKELIEEQLAVPDSLKISSGAEKAMSNLRRQVIRGKMLRPGLVLLSGACCGEITDVHIRVAAIVEMIHNATLLHDDVIDEGQKRRGEPTVNSLYGNEFAVLLGDFLLSRVFRMCADLEPRVTAVIAAATARTCEGELRQIIQKGNRRLSEPEYIDIITEKSAALFSSACLLGGLLSGASEEQLRRLSEFGLNTGIAFQITDDLLDIIGDENKTGKSLGSDIDKNKLTLALIHLLKEVSERERIAVIEELNAGSDNKQTLAEMLGHYGSLEYVCNRSQEFISKATASLTGLKESNAKEALIETARFVAGKAIYG